MEVISVKASVCAGNVITVLYCVLALLVVDDGGGDDDETVLVVVDVDDDVVVVVVLVVVDVDGKRKVIAIVIGPVTLKM